MPNSSSVMLFCSFFTAMACILFLTVIVIYYCYWLLKNYYHYYCHNSLWALQRSHRPQNQPNLSLMRTHLCMVEMRSAIWANAHWLHGCIFFIEFCLCINHKSMITKKSKRTRCSQAKNQKDCTKSPNRNKDYTDVYYALLIFNLWFTFLISTWILSHETCLFVLTLHSEIFLFHHNVLWFTHHFTQQLSNSREEHESVFRFSGY